MNFFGLSLLAPGPGAGKHSSPQSNRSVTACSGHTEAYYDKLEEQLATWRARYAELEERVFLLSKTETDLRDKLQQEREQQRAEEEAGLWDFAEWDE